MPNGVIISSFETSCRVCFRKDVESREGCLGADMPEHCFVSASQLTVRLPWRSSEKFRVTLRALRLIPHPQYRHRCRNNDIALIELPKDLSCNSFTIPLCLPTQDEIKKNIALIIAGWGAVTSDGEGGHRFLHKESCRSQKNKNPVSHKKNPASRKSIMYATKINIL
ncbi:peptidase S1 domain-containing protein [Caerostris extrusa]|uniref:Peptidase S1 domain-containing protein n=1 Tax=Caerostris extrusa TaxID=172846 RepID=A0AAV4U2L9_CAEEX|nr:peptidase S1 domain-containing protein [Caerostris extrusa]